MRIGVGIGITFIRTGGAGDAPLPVTLARADITLDREDITLATLEA